MTTFSEIPLSGTPQAFNIALPQSNTQPLQVVQYRMVLQYRAAPLGGWVMDLYDGLGNPLLCGTPLVTGADLLAQFAYLGLGGGIGIYSDGVPDAVPSFDNLGSGSHMIWVTQP